MKIKKIKMDKVTHIKVVINNDEEIDFEKGNS